MATRAQAIDLHRNGHFEGIIDIYKGNEPFDLAEAKRLGVRAVFYRTSLGLKHDDRVAYRTAKSKAQALSLLWGAYHVVSGKPVDEQLARFLEIEDGNDPKVAMAIDWESTSEGPMPYTALRDFIIKFKDRTGFYPMLYGGQEVRGEPALRTGDSLLTACPLWYVREGQPETKLGIPAKTWSSYTLWQFDDEKRLYGAPYPKAVLPGADWNRFKGTEQELLDAWPFQAR